VRGAVPGGADGFVDFVKRADPPVMGESETDAHREFARLCQGVLRPGGDAASVTNGGVPALLGDIRFTNVHSTPSPATLERLASLVDSGAVAPIVAGVFPFERIESAFEHLNSHGTLGKIAVAVAEV
jgi:NADPH:quinone reductase-like Zn-dependent oxidoreductase